MTRTTKHFVHIEILLTNFEPCQSNKNNTNNVASTCLCIEILTYAFRRRANF